MQAARPALPELDARGHDPQPSPEVGHGNVLPALERLLRVGHPPLQLGPAVVAVHGPVRLEHLALAARPGADPAAPDPRVEVLLALAGRVAARDALDAHLPLQRGPEEDERGVRVGGQVGGLARRPKVGVDDEAARRVELLEVDDARGDAARRQLGRGQGARLGLRDGRGLRLREPAVELGRRRRRVQVPSRERRLGELLGLAVGGGAGRCDWERGSVGILFFLILFLLLPSSRANPRRRASAGVVSFFFPSFSWFQGEAGLQMSLAWDGRRYSAMVVRANSALGRVQRINE